MRIYASAASEKQRGPIEGEFGVARSERCFVGLGILTLLTRCVPGLALILAVELGEDSLYRVTEQVDFPL
jgi:hypothetical protein